MVVQRTVTGQRRGVHCTTHHELFGAGAGGAGAAAGARGGRRAGGTGRRATDRTARSAMCGTERPVVDAVRAAGGRYSRRYTVQYPFTILAGSVCRA